MNIMDSFSLKGKTAVITGGSGLYGRQMVLALAQAGAKVYTVSRTLESNEEYASKLRAEGYDVWAGQMDQSDDDSIKAFLDTVKAKGDKVDILVNNAVARVTKGYHDVAENFDKSFHINCTGLILVSRAFGDYMAQCGGGSIINIGSYMGLLGPDYTLYEGTSMTSSMNMAGDYFLHKGGMENYTRFLASHYGADNIRCNVLHLGGFFNNQDPVFVERYSKKTFLGRMANETDIMGAVVFLASDASAYLTGASITLDGGYTAK